MIAWQLRRASKLFVQGIPPVWDSQEVSRRFSLVGEVKQVDMIKNAIGINSGKVVVHYVEDNGAAKAIEKFDNRAVENLVIRCRPFFEGRDSARPRQ